VPPGLADYNNDYNTTVHQQRQFKILLYGKFTPQVKQQQNQARNQSAKQLKS